MVTVVFKVKSFRVLGTFLEHIEILKHASSIIVFIIVLFIYLLLHWVYVTARTFSLVATTAGYSSLRWVLLLQKSTVFRKCDS